MEAVSKKYGADYGVLKKKVEEIGNRLGLGPKEPGGEKTDRPKLKPKSGFREAEKLILTSLAEHPELLTKICSVLSPEDFWSETAKKTAAILFQAGKDGKPVTPAAVMDRFESDETCAEVAELFSSTFTETVSAEDAERALDEALKKVKTEALDRAIAEATDPVKFQALLAEKKKL